MGRRVYGATLIRAFADDRDLTNKLKSRSRVIGGNKVSWKCRGLSNTWDYGKSRLDRHPES